MAIMKCGGAGCASEFQDAEFGPGMRVCNETKTKGRAKEYRCTVCETKHVGRAVAATEEK